MTDAPGQPPATAEAGRDTAPVHADGPHLREVVAWSLFDAANSAFSLVIVTAVFVIYFKRVVVGAELQGRGDFLWGISISTAELLVALSSPFMGALADARGWRKRLLAIYTAASVTAIAALGFSGPGTVAFTMVAFIIANAAFEGGMVFYGSLLPSVATPERMGRVSGAGWATGYIGGMICLLACAGLAQAGEVPKVVWIVAAWFAVFSLPLFLWVRDRVPPASGASEGVLRTLRQTLARAWRSRDMRTFLIAFFLYNDAIVTTFAFAAPFAVDELGFSTGGVIRLVLGVQITGALGAFTLGRVADRIGNARTIAITLVLWLVVTMAAFLTALDLPFWGGREALRSGVFVGIGLLVGLAMGASQAASRSFLAAAVPAERAGEYFGLGAVAGKVSAVIGPTLFGAVSFATGSKAWSVLSLGIMFAAGLALVVRIDEKRARAQLAEA